MSPVQCCALVGLALAALAPVARSQEAERRTESELLPKAPAAKPKPWRPANSIDDVPEVCLEERVDLRIETDKDDKEGLIDAHIRSTLENIRRLDRQRPAGFVAAIKKHRPDLAGLPFLVGKEVGMNPVLCKYFVESSSALTDATVVFRGAGFAGGDGFAGGLGGALGNGGGIPTSTMVTPNSFSTIAWAYSNPSVKPKVTRKSEAELQAYVLLAKQRLYPRDAEGRMALVQILQATPLRDSNAHLAHLAMFAPEADVREAAIASLKVRRNEGYAEILIEGLAYPLPAVANNAADAIIKLELTELLPKIATKLDTLHGQTPQVDEDGTVRVREVVKINHSRNCMLCHAPAPLSADKVKAAGDPFAAPVPNPRRSLEVYYGTDDLAKAIRFDATYLRPDFSLLLPVAKDAKSEEWPTLQRFDFIVRDKTLSLAEKESYDKARDFLPASPNREAALRVLRELSEVDLGSVEAWQKHFKAIEDAMAGTMG